MAYKANRHGFTVVEVMIALSVFAVAMVLVLAAVIFISRQYQQATNRVALEDAARNVHQQLTQSIQFSGTPLPASAVTNSGYAAWCVGNYMYIFPRIVSPSGFTGSATDFDSLPDGLYIRPNNGCQFADIAVPSPLPSDMRNLLPPGAKVTKFTINPSGVVSTVFAKSPGDLLTIPPAGDPMRGEVYCASALSGREFCATVKLESAASRRVGV